MSLDIRRPAICHRFKADANLLIIKLCESQYQFGDVIMVPVADRPGEFHFVLLGPVNFSCIDLQTSSINTWPIVSAHNDMAIPFRITRHLDDAFLHYQSMLDENARLTPHLVIRLHVAATDPGIARIFNASEREREIYQHWKTIDVSCFASNQFGIQDVDFGNGLTQTLFASRFLRNQLLFNVNDDSVRRLSLLGPLIDLFHETQETLISGFLVIGYDPNNMPIDFVPRIYSALPPRITAEGSSAFMMGKRAHRVVRVCGPASEMLGKSKCKTLALAVGGLFYALDRVTFGRPKLKCIVLEGDSRRTPPPLVFLTPYDNFVDFLACHFRGTLGRNPWSMREYQWQSVHRRIMTFCLVFAPLNLPPYVQLEILDWLPQCYLSRHIWKIQLIGAIIDSVRKVRRERGEFITHAGRATKPRYAVQKVKL
jgi:hypothetical protein